MFLLGLDIGSSSVKASLVDAGTSAILACVQSPETEMPIASIAAGWAEQEPELWWKHIRIVIQKLIEKTAVRASKIAAIGISYQMHGLVVLGHDGQPLRPAIIWCDSRAVEIGHSALHELGEDYTYGHCLNSPGNFTASKLKWVKDNEPNIYERIWKVMLPGDYVAYRMTGEALTTVGGLSEGVFWDFKDNHLATHLLEYYGIDSNLIPDRVATFGQQGKLTAGAAHDLGLVPGTAITYRAGDQPNNALSLNVLNPGEIAATGGTSGVVYGISEQLIADRKNRVNSFAHVNHQADQPRIGVLLCINGAGIQYSWVRRLIAGENVSYQEMEQAAAGVPVGSDGLRIIPFGNGAERLFQNQNPGAQIQNLHFNRHDKAHLYRSALEGVAFSFVYGMKALAELGLNTAVLRVGNDNLFQSPIFSSTISNLLNCQIELMHTTGATGAAIASGVGIDIWSDVREGLGHLEKAGVFEPVADNKCACQEAYLDWEARLLKMIRS